MLRIVNIIQCLVYNNIVIFISFSYYEKANGKLNKNLARNLRIARASQNISQEELASRCNLHRTYIGAIERCERNVTLRTLEVLGSGLEMSPLELLK